MSETIKILDPAFEYANEYVLENTRCPAWETFPPVGATSGRSRLWGKQPSSRCESGKGHWFVVFDEVAYDSDTTKERFAPFEW